MQPDLSDVDAIDDDRSTRRFDDTKQGEGEGRLARPCTPHNAHLQTGSCHSAYTSGQTAVTHSLPHTSRQTAVTQPTQHLQTDSCHSAYPTPPDLQLSLSLPHTPRQTAATQTTPRLQTGSCHPAYPTPTDRQLSLNICHTAQPTHTDRQL